jgi:hypothetical protein
MLRLEDVHLRSMQEIQRISEIDDARTSPRPNSGGPLGSEMYTSVSAVRLFVQLGYGRSTHGTWKYGEIVLQYSCSILEKRTRATHTRSAD